MEPLTAESAEGLSYVASAPSAPSAKVERACIVCLDVFMPRRVDQVFCRYNHGCGNMLNTVEHSIEYMVEFAKALLTQAWRCWACQREAPLRRLRTIEESYGLVAGPKAPGAGAPLQPLILLPFRTDSRVVASCMDCRKKHYQALARQAVDIEHYEIRSEWLINALGPEFDLIAG